MEEHRLPVNALGVSAASLRWRFGAIKTDHHRSKKEDVERHQF